MKGAELYERLINWPDRQMLTVLLGAALSLIVLASILLALGRFRLLARIIGVVAVVMIMLDLFIVLEQTVTEKVGPYISVTRYRAPDTTRFQIQIVLLSLPAVAATVMATVLGITRRRLRLTVPHHLKEGRKLLVLGQHDAALAEINKAIDISPYLGEAYFLRGCALEAVAKPDLALDDFDRALRCDPQLAHAYLHRGRLRTEKGEFDAALADFDQVMNMRPNDAECYLNRGICLAKKGMLSDATDDFRRVLKLTNHSDYADPARFYLDQLSGDQSRPGPEPSHLPSPNGSGHAPSASSHQPPNQDSVV
jgi:tetratricopeptide (TPR) repeat protein